MAINFLFDVAVNSGIDLQNTSITSLATPVNNTDAATKAYVDSLVTASDLDFSGTSGTGAIDLDSQVFAVTGGTFISTAASGQSLSIDLNATGSSSATTFLRGDNTWSTPPDNNTTYTFAAVSGTPNLIRLTGTNPSSNNDIGLVATGNIAITFNSATSLGFDLASSISVANTITAGTGLTVTAGGVDVTGTGTFNTGISVTGDSSINGELDMSSNKIINVTDPTNAQDAATKNYVDITSTSGAVNFQGGYDAATNTPDLDSSPSSAIKKGWMYTVTADGTFFTEQVRTGDSLIAQIDAPTTLANWTTVQNNIDLADASTVGIGNVAGTTNDINVIYSAGTATVSQAPITISQTTSNISPGFGSGFTAIDSVGANSTGHVTSLNLKTINLPTPTFTSVGITETGNALTITNSPITTSGNINIAGAGTASQVILGNLTLGTYTTGTVESVGTSNSTFINGSGGPITSSGSLTYSLSATGTPSALTYLRGDNTWASLPTDNNNYVTSASFDTSTGVLTLSRQGLTAITVDLDGRYLTGNQTITLTGDITGTGTTSIATTISSNVVGADELNVSSNGTSGQVLTSDGLGAFTWSTPFTGDITGVTAGNGLTGGGTAGTVTLTVGAGTGIQVNSTNVALATAGAGAGTYGSTSNSTKIDTITLDAYGRVTSVATGFTGSGDVTGSGTASVTGGQIPYWDATTNITGTTELNYSTVSGGSIGVVGIGNSSTAFGASRLVVGSGSGASLMTLYGGSNSNGTIAFANGTSGNAQYRGQVRYNLQNDNLEFLTNGETFSRVYVDSAFDLNLVERSLNFRNSWPYDVGAYIDIPSNNQLSIGTNGSERMRFDSAGEISVYNDFVIDNGSPEMYFKTGATHYRWMVAAQENVDAALEITPSTAVGGGTYSTPVAVFKATGEVGIGTTSPSSLLHVLGSPVATSGALITARNHDATSSNTTFGGIMFNSSPGTDYSIGKSNVNSATSLSFRNANTGVSYMDINSDGSIRQGNSSATGQYAAAFGQNNTASSLDAFATGEDNTSSGRQSFTAGFDNVASGNASFAVGGGTTASGENSFAACGTTVASGISSAAFGAFSEATATNAFAINGDNTASGESSFALGVTSTAQALGSIASGLNCSTGAGANGAFAGGTVSNANNQFSIAYGDTANASGRVSQALGYIVTATAQYSFAQGFNNTVNGTASAVFGQQNLSTATAAWSLSTGFLNTTRDSASLTVGSFNGMTASIASREQFMLGRYLNVPRDSSGNPSAGCLVVGEHNTYLNRVGVKFAVGTGVGVGAEADSFTVLKDGNVLMEQVVNKNYSSDSAAAAGGVPVGGIYHNSGDLKIRLT